MSTKKPSNLLFSGIALFVLSIWMFNGSHYRSALKTKSWSSVTGTITQSQIQHVNPNHIRDSYRPNISYSYQVNGINYQGNTVYKGDKSMGFNKKNSVQKIMNRYPVGKTVRVYYSPLQAQSSVLIAGPIKLHYLNLFLSIACFLAGAFCLRFWYLKHLKARQ